MPEFVIMNCIDKKDFTVVAEDRFASNMALFRYLESHGLQICVLKHDVINRSNTFDLTDELYLVMKGQKYFDPWLKDAYDKGRKEPIVRYIDSLNDDAVDAWARDIMPKELWTYHVEHDYNRDFPKIRCYGVYLRHFAPITHDLESSPEYTGFREGGYLAARVIKEMDL